MKKMGVREKIKNEAQLSHNKEGAMNGCSTWLV